MASVWYSLVFNMVHASSLIDPPCFWWCSFL